MHTHEITIPEIGLVAGTRAILGAGIGLLLAGLMSDGQRKGAGWALLAVGALTTVPLAMTLLGKQRFHSADGRSDRRESSSDFGTPANREPQFNRS